MSEQKVLPLMNSVFKPGNAIKAINEFKDKDMKNIARAELHYFMGEADACSRMSDLYLSSQRLELRLSACILSAFSNLTLGNIDITKQRLNEIGKYVQMDISDKSSRECYASCIFAGYLGSVLLHWPTDGLPDMKHYIKYLPQGLQFFAIYIKAHAIYVKGEYERAVGMCQSALLFCDKSYLISMIYLYCMIAICEMNMKNIKEAKKALLMAWNMARKDKLTEPFIEHHGLFQGLIESCIKNEESNKLYAKLSEAVISFSRGWMQVYNKVTQNTVTDQLTTTEFSIAMLASRDWSNQEIADYMGISINTVKHYLSDIYLKVGVKKRSELKDFVLK